MVVVQAHNDDFDLSLSGQALMLKQQGGEVIVITVTDCSADFVSYDELLKKGLIVEDGIFDGHTLAPDGQLWTRSFYSNSLSQFRMSKMQVRYRTFGFISLQPDRFVPDQVCAASESIRTVYGKYAVDDIFAKLNVELDNISINKGKVFRLQFYFHDSNVTEHGDHVFAGELGLVLFSRIKSYELNSLRRRFDLLPPKFFYVYTNSIVPRTGYSVVNVASNVLPDKRDIYLQTWEAYFDLPCDSWYKNPDSKNNVWFLNEVVRN